MKDKPVFDNNGQNTNQKTTKLGQTVNPAKKIFDDAAKSKIFIKKAGRGK